MKGNFGLDKLQSFNLKNKNSKLFYKKLQK